jgi:tetratricopeptide (TPR) repeat protein
MPFWVKSTPTDGQKLLAAYQKEKQATAKFWKQLDLANHYLNHNFKQADSIRFDLFNASRIENDSAKLHALIYDIKVEGLSGNKSAYKSKIMLLQAFFSKTKSTIDQISIVQYMVEYYTLDHQYNKALIFGNEALTLSKKIRNYKLIAKSNRLIAKVYMFQNKREVALQYIEKAIQYAKRSSDKSVMANCVNSQAVIYQFYGDIELSVSKNFIALNLAKEAGSLPLVSNIQREIGEAQLQINNTENANSFFKQSIETARHIHLKRNIALAEIDLGLVQLQRSNFEETILHFQSAKITLEEINDLDGLGTVNKCFGNLYNKHQDYDKALSYYNQALIQFEAGQNRSEIASVYHLVGSVFAEQGKATNAINYLTRSIQIREELGHLSASYNSFKELSEIYRKKGDVKKAYEYLVLYSDYADSARSVEVSTKIAELSVLYRSQQQTELIETQKNSLELQRKEKENSELRNRFQSYVILGILLLIVFAAILVRSRWKQRNIVQLQREAEMNQTLLRSQMNPHFVFNAMSVIQSYIYENDTKNSSKFLVHFSKLMRLILENSSKEFISLTTEVDILTKYMETQKMRFGNRFKFSIHVDEILETDQVIIPPMITQPFIENSIEHGQLHTVKNGFIDVHFSKRNNLLYASIRDNGIGRKEAGKIQKSSAHKSMAISITQDRINNLNYKYKTDCKIQVTDIQEDDETGTLVEIYLPYKSEAF